MRGPFRRVCMARLVAALSYVAVHAAPAWAQESAARNYGTISGRVVDSLAVPVAGASVTLDTLGITARTDSTGFFRMAGVPPGRRTLIVHELGFAATSVSVSLAPGASAKQTITMAAASAEVLPAVKSQAVGQFGKPARLAYTLKYDEFYQRRSQSTGSGQFYTHEDLEAMKTADFPDILRRVRYLRIRDDLDGTQLSFPGCSTNHILIELDNRRVWPTDSLLMNSSSGKVPIPPPNPLQNGSPGPQMGGRTEDPFELIATLHLQNVEALEVYKDMASLPMDAAIPGICGAILIWTR